MERLKGLAAGAVMLVSATVMAAGEQGVKGDATRGASKTATCLACHGQDGNSVNAALGPKIAGQHPHYIARQLQLYQSGGRTNPIMAPMAAGLSPQDIADLAAHFSSQSVSEAATEDDLLELGRKIYRVGNAQTGVPACMACHGPAGSGNPLAGYPSLAGQHAQYTAEKLSSFREGEVWGEGDDANAVMAGVSKMLTDEQIKAVSSYIQGLH